MSRLFQSHEDVAWANAAPELCAVLEGYSPTAIVGWYNTIKFKLRDMIAKQEASRNNEYADLLRTYANTWEKYPIDSNMNREVLELLVSSAEPYSKMEWNQQTFFDGLSRSLRQLIADQEALPGGVDTEQNMGMVGGAGGSSMPPASPGFGPGEDAPPGMDGGAGDDLGGAGGAPPVPGAEGDAAPAGGPEPLPGAEPPGTPPGAPARPGQRKQQPPPPL